MHNQIDSSFILACAPENSAADLLAERLLAHIDKGKIFRMYAASRPWDFVPQPLKVKSESLSPGFNLVKVNVHCIWWRIQCCSRGVGKVKNGPYLIEKRVNDTGGPYFSPAGVLLHLV